MNRINHTIEENIPEKLRLDRYISDYLHLFSRSQIKARELEGLINNKKVKFSRIIKKGDILELSWKNEETSLLMPEDINLKIIYEDDNVIVIDKPQGMVVHPGAGNWHGTLANALYYIRLKKNKDNTGECIRPGIVHRLDKDTSGVMIAAYDDETHKFLSDQFKARKVKKTYYSIVKGKMNNNIGSIETLLTRDTKNRKKFMVSNRGKYSLTHYKVIKTWNNYSFVLLRPKTGRTHQLRVHMRYIGNPIIGDSIYGVKDNYFYNETLMLHAKKLEITLPVDNKPRIFKTELPERFKSLINKLDSYD